MRIGALALGAAGLLSACVTADEGRRGAYLACAREQGVPVRDGTIRARGAADMAALDACEALPR